MAPKPEPEEPVIKKGKKPLTEEEKKIKAEMMALQAEEMRKKKIRDRRDQIKKHMVDEEKLSKMSMLKIHKDWRKILRESKVQDLRRDIEWLAEKHVHQVEVKDATIADFRKSIEEAEGQQQTALSKHLNMLDVLIDLHYMRMRKMDEEFKGHFQILAESFSTEHEHMIGTHDAQKKEMVDMISSMKTEFEEALGEKRQEFETTGEEIKNKNIEEYNVMRISLESGIEALERQIEHTHETYLQRTEVKTISFKDLSAKDAITSRLIEQRMRKLVRLHDNLAYVRAHMAVNSKEWEVANKALQDEKGRINKHYQNLKKALNRLHDSEHIKLKKISNDVGEVSKDLQTKLSLAKRLLKLAAFNCRLETEHEKIFPFDPLYVSSIPTLPGARLDEEMAADDSSCKAVAVVPTVELNRVVPRARERSIIDVELPITSQLPTEPVSPQGSKFWWSSHAVDDAGVEVEELDYLAKFYRRYNKVMLDKMAIELERNKRGDENFQLQTALSNYLDGLTMSERIKSGYNALLTVNRKPVSIRSLLKNVYDGPPKKAKKPL